MAEVMKFCRVNFNYNERKFIFHSSSRRSIEFVKIPKGLFYHDPTANGNKKEVVMVNAVKEIMEGYTRHEFWSPNNQGTQRGSWDILHKCI